MRRIQSSPCSVHSTRERCDGRIFPVLREESQHVAVRDTLQIDSFLRVLHAGPLLPDNGICYGSGSVHNCIWSDGIRSTRCSCCVLWESPMREVTSQYEASERETRATTKRSGSHKTCSKNNNPETNKKQKAAPRIIDASEDASSQGSVCFGHNTSTSISLTCKAPHNAHDRGVLDERSLVHTTQSPSERERFCTIATEHCQCYKKQPVRVRMPSTSIASSDQVLHLHLFLCEFGRHVFSGGTCGDGRLCHYSRVKRQFRVFCNESQLFKSDHK